MIVFANIRDLLRQVAESKIDPANVLTATEACEVLGIKRQRLDAMIGRGELDGYRAGRLLFLNRRSVSTRARALAANR